jgi:hypothetical protein
MTMRSNQDSVCVPQVEGGTQVKRFSHTYRQTDTLAHSVLISALHKVTPNFLILLQILILATRFTFHSLNHKSVSKTPAIGFIQCGREFTDPLLHYLVFMCVIAVCSGTLHTARDVRLHVSMVSRGAVISRPFSTWLFDKFATRRCRSSVIIFVMSVTVHAENLEVTASYQIYIYIHTHTVKLCWKTGVDSVPDRNQNQGYLLGGKGVKLNIKYNRSGFEWREH